MNLAAKVPIGALAAAFLISDAAPALAASEEDLAAIRSAISKLREDYEAKIKDLEDRLQKAETETAAAKASAAAAETAAQEAQKTAQAAPPSAPIPEPPQIPRVPQSQNAFNPGIAAVLNGFFVAANHDPTDIKIPGFALGDQAAGSPRGFSIGESEVNLTANIDPFTLGWLNLAFEPDNSVSVEEAYIQTTSLGSGFTLRAGRFFSGIAYLNERHAHDWSFSDASLPYRVFLNGQYGDDGLQARWLAPTNIFLELGTEIMRGDAFPAGGAANHGVGSFSLFAHAGDDINDSSSWLAGLSFLHTRSDRREDTAGDIFSGTDNIGIASAVYKWAPGGNPTIQNLILSSEVFFGSEDGHFNGVKVNTNRTGWYLQGVYQFQPRWSFGLRYAQLGSNDVPLALVGSTIDNMGWTPRAESALLEFDTSEFGRFRLQYNHDDSDRRPIDEVLLQYTVIYGPHPAHRY
jgi:hypothetical protein